MNETAFFDLAERVNARLRGGERLFQRLGSERSTFVRLNRNRVRQAGTVERAVLDLTLIDGGRQIDGSCELSGHADDDAARAGVLLERLRERLPHLPEDPYLHFSEQADESWQDRQAALPGVDEAVGTIADLADGLDLVGIWAAGSVAEGLASSIGHRHWHRSESFNLDWSCFLEADKAVKARYGGFDWQPAALAERLGAQREELAVMARPAQQIEPGRYRAFLAPAALEELIDLLAWGGFGLRDHRTRQSPLQRLAEGEVTLHPAFSLSEEAGRGLSPGFTAEGFRIPDQVGLIERGRFGHCLADARSAKEYGETVNAAAEWPESVAVAAGALPAGEVLQRLGTGLYIGNLWYGNWSDRNAGRVTGMTRFGTFWVENGELRAPLAVMRFDDSLLRVFGEALEDLTETRELLLSAETYDGRSTASALLPGALVSGLTLTL